VALSVSVIGPTDTMAYYIDDIWAKGAGLTASKFGIQSSLTATGTFSDSAKELTGSIAPGTVAFTTPISLNPGMTSYAPVYLRTSPGTSRAATVSTSAAARRAGAVSNDALWNTYVTYAARAVPITTSAVCNAAVFSATPQGALLYGSGTGATADVALASVASTATFPLSPNGGSTYMVCFRFSLNSTVTSGAPTGTNGASVFPVWTFTGMEN